MSMSRIRHFARKSVLNSSAQVFISLFLIGFLIGLALFSGLFSGFTLHYPQANKSTVSVDPYDVFRDLKKGSERYILIDIRSKEAYADSRIKSAWSFPIYSKNEEPLEIDKDRLNVIIKEIPNKENKVFVVYGHSAASDLPQKLASELEKRGLDSAVLAIGWNEWRHFRNLWLPESLWNSVHIEDVVTVE